MNSCCARFTVFFESPYWVGVYERRSEDRLEVCKITFGAEPKTTEIYEFLLKNWRTFHFSPPVVAEPIAHQPVNPKRMQRQIRRQLHADGVGSKSQQALQRQYEQRKATHQAVNRKRNADEKRNRFEMKQEKKRAKRRGR